jgi:hypothetical protein
MAAAPRAALPTAPPPPKTTHTQTRMHARTHARTHARRQTHALSRTHTRTSPRILNIALRAQPSKPSQPAKLRTSANLCVCV